VFGEGSADYLSILCLYRLTDILDYRQTLPPKIQRWAQKPTGLRFFCKVEVNYAGLHVRNCYQNQEILSDISTKSSYKNRQKNVVTTIYSFFAFQSSVPPLRLNSRQIY
jgi:hypothetical protein